jgi:ketosteroid isomerase-like protein
MSAVARFLDGLARRDITAAMVPVAEDVDVTVYPLAVRDEGTGALRAVLHDLLTTFPDLRVTTKRLIVTGDVVTAEIKLDGTQAADYAGAFNQEKHVDLDQAWRFAVGGGQITEVRVYWCRQQLLRRLGVKRLDQVAIL